MRNTRYLISILLVLTLALSAFAFSACSLFPDNNPPVTGGGEKDSYLVSFVSGAEDAVGIAPETKTYEEGSTIKLPANPFIREGYSFKGWSDGSKTYSAGVNYTLGKGDVTFTAVWEEIGDDTPTLSELDAKFYDASNWVYMTNNDGASNDGGDIPYSMADGSIKFHKANQAIEIGDMTNSTVSFMLKATNDFSIWFNSSTKDNHNNSSYRLAYAYGGLRIALSSAPEQAAALIGGDLYNKGEWNRFDIAFSTVDGVTEIKVYINGVRAALSAGDNTAPAISVANNTLTHTQPAMFKTGNYMVVKVWEAHNYVQLKPVAKADEKDLPIVACIGASITEGAGAGDGPLFYTLSYPAQLQNALGGQYNVINFGNSGKTVREDLGDVAWLKQYQWQGVQAIVPDIAILNIGTNDSKTSNSPATTTENFYEAYSHLIAKLLEVNPNMQIVVCTVPYAYSSEWNISNDNIANIIAPVQRTIAEENDYTLIDLYEYTQGKAHLFPDGIHPNAEGYEMIVKIIKKALLEGDDALTDEFIESIRSEYVEKIENVSASIKTEGDKILLTVTGDTTLASGSYLKLAVTPGATGGASVDATIADGKFTATIDLASVPRANEWFNVRLYTSDSANQLVLMSQTEYSQGQEFAAGNTKVTLKSWDSGSGMTLSFTIGDNSYVKFNSVTIHQVDGVPTLTVIGASSDANAKFFVGVDPNKADAHNFYSALTFADGGNFSVSFDLTKLVADGGWYNARVYLTDGSYYSVPLTLLKDADGNAITKDTSFSTDSLKYTICTWNDGGVGTLSFSVSAINKDYFLVDGQISASNVPVTMTQEDGKVYYNFVGGFNGDASIDRTIELVLTLADPADRPESLDASQIVYTASNTYVGDSKTAFAFKINATDDIGTQGGWIRLVLKVTEGDTVSYYTIKPIVPSHNGDWVACADPITLNGVKYEMAICWSSFFFQVKNA